MAGSRGRDSRQQHRRLVSRARQRLAEASGGSPFIATVRGLGLQWENLAACNRRDDIRGAHRDARVHLAVLDGSADLRLPSRAD